MRPNSVNRERRGSGLVDKVGVSSLGKLDLNE